MLDMGLLFSDQLHNCLWHYCCTVETARSPDERQYQPFRLQFCCFSPFYINVYRIFWVFFLAVECKTQTISRFRLKLREIVIGNDQSMNLKRNQY